MFKSNVIKNKCCLRKKLQCHSICFIAVRSTKYFKCFIKIVTKALARTSWQYKLDFNKTSNDHCTIIFIKIGVLIPSLTFIKIGVYKV